MTNYNLTVTKKVFKLDAQDSLNRKFRVFLILSISGLAISFFCKSVVGIAEYAMYAFEGVTVVTAGILCAVGIYLQGFEEGKKYVEKENKNP